MHGAASSALGSEPSYSCEASRSRACTAKGASVGGPDSPNTKLVLHVQHMARPEDRAKEETCAAHIMNARDAQWIGRPSRSKAGLHRSPTAIRGMNSQCSYGIVYRLVLVKGVILSVHALIPLKNSLQSSLMFVCPFEVT